MRKRLVQQSATQRRIAASAIASISATIAAAIALASAVDDSRSEEDARGDAHVWGFARKRGAQYGQSPHSPDDGHRHSGKHEKDKYFKSPSHRYNVMKKSNGIIAKKLQP